MGVGRKRGTRGKSCVSIGSVCVMWMVDGWLVDGVAGRRCRALAFGVCFSLRFVPFLSLMSRTQVSRLSLTARSAPQLLPKGSHFCAGSTLLTVRRVYADWRFYWLTRLGATSRPKQFRWVS